MLYIAIDHPAKLTHFRDILIHPDPQNNASLICKSIAQSSVQVGDSGANCSMNKID